MLTLAAEFSTTVMESRVLPNLSVLSEHASVHAPHIRAVFEGLAVRVREGAVPTHIRTEILRRHRPDMSPWKSNIICSTCLLRSPDHILACGHTMCESCIHDHFPLSLSYHYTDITRCLVCGRAMSQRIFIKPATMKPSLLAIDGGGVRGIISLELLNRLEKSLDVPTPIWGFFDLIVGTSAGE